MTDLTDPLAIPDTLTGQVEETTMAQDPATDTWLEERKTMLGGTDAAAILGLSPWRTAWDVWAEKRGIIPPQEGNERMQWGSLLEEPIAKEYARRTGQRIKRTNEPMRDKEFPFLGGHPDRLVIGQRRGVEVKTVAGFAEREWSLPGEPMRVPKAYYIQCQHYLSISRFDAWDLVPLLGMKTMRIYPIAPNPQVIGVMRARLQDFWERYVMGTEAPPIEPSEAAKAWLKATYPTHDDTLLLVANEEQEKVIAKWAEAKDKAARWKKEEEKYKLRLAAAIGAASGIRYGHGLVTYRKDRDSTALVTDWEGVALWLCEQANIDLPAEEIQRRTQTITTREGARKMLLKPMKEG